MAPPFRAEHIGSLLRPAPLVSASAAAGTFEYGYKGTVPESLQALTRSAITAAVQKQLDLSIRPITSGEYERYIFYGGFFEKLEGFEVHRDLKIPDAFRSDFPTILELQRRGVKTRNAVVATGKIRNVGSVYMEEWEDLKAVLPEEKWGDCNNAWLEAFKRGDDREKSVSVIQVDLLTMPSPTWQHMQLRAGTAYTPAAYTTDKAYFQDMATAYATEFRALHAAGLRSIQVDDPNLTYFLTSDFINGCAKDGVNSDELLDLYIWAHNESLANHPKDLHVGIHLCRGNMPGSTNMAAGSYERIAQKLFAGLNYDTFYLEYDTERSGDFEPLRFLPVGKNVVLGVVSTKVPELEDLDELVGRVEEAADVIARGQGRSREVVIKEVLGVSPQCGFASVSWGGGTGFTEERMWEKLVLVRDLARKIWPGEAI